ncbi:hypothetical protein IQ238_03465 [Pleurocapsales cyanobacterium LEGE 06147]|nr:hypothetical protein [Pleurocapsales cyanobacterium LEGE 06147]
MTPVYFLAIASVLTGGLDIRITHSGEVFGIPDSFPGVTTTAEASRDWSVGAHKHDFRSLSTV